MDTPNIWLHQPCTNVTICLGLDSLGPMRTVAVLGGGIGGLAASYYLCKSPQVTKVTHTQCAVFLRLLPLTCDPVPAAHILVCLSAHSNLMIHHSCHLWNWSLSLRNSCCSPIFDCFSSSCPEYYTHDITHIDHSLASVVQKHISTFSSFVQHPPSA